jgi:hypothetical protein
MFAQRTLFVLGAGSSFEAGLPLGTALAKIIREKMDIRFERFTQPVGTGDHDLFAHVAYTHRQKADAFQQAAWRIGQGLGLAQSIDDFLDQHRSDGYVNHYGKVAIARAILEAERGSKLYFKDQNIHTGEDEFDPDKFANTWFSRFIYMLGRGVPRETVGQIFDNVSFIIFNYDRCVEHFLQSALKRLYNIDEQDAITIVDKLRIIHPYGRVGSLREVPFGATRANYDAIASTIKTYTEQVADAEAVRVLASEFEQASRVIFLGFAYHSQNMRLLKPPKSVAARPIYGTAFKMSDADIGIVEGQLASWLDSGVRMQERKGMIKIENKLQCFELFDYYAKSLSGD